MRRLCPAGFACYDVPAWSYGGYRHRLAGGCVNTLDHEGREVSVSISYPYPIPGTPTYTLRVSCSNLASSVGVARITCDCLFCDQMVQNE